MIFKKIFFIGAILFFIASSSYADVKKSQEESTQQIGDFSLAGYGERGKKSWDLSGKSADIFDETVKLKEVVGNLYGEQENIKLTANKGDFNKNDGKVHLEQDVVITTSSGTKMTTDSLDWDRKNQLVTTSDPVNIEKDNMVIVAKGARSETNLKKVDLQKEVRLDINPVSPQENHPDKAGNVSVKQEKIVVTCDGPLEVDYEKNIATFNNNVKVERLDTVIYSDKMDVYFITEKKDEPKSEKPILESVKAKEAMNSKIDKIVARGNVKVERGLNISYSEEAIYTALDKKLVLTGRPRLVITSTEDIKNASFGN